MRSMNSLLNNKSTACGADAWLQLLLENSKTKKGHNYIKKVLKVTCQSGMGFPFDSKQLKLVSSKYLQ